MKLLTFLCSVFLLVVSGCSCSTDIFAALCELPPVPDSWAGCRDWNEGFRILYRSDTGHILETDFTALPEEMLLYLPKGSNRPVLAYIDGCTVPAGAIIPWDLDDNGNLIFSWEHGWTALLLFRLSSGDGVFEALNVRRLFTEAMERSGGDPWRLDMDYALTALSIGGFSLYSLRLLQTHPLEFFPGPGGWVFDDPFRDEVYSDAGGRLGFDALEEGYHVLHPVEDEGRMDLYLTDEGYCIVNRMNGDTVFGHW